MTNGTSLNQEHEKPEFLKIRLLDKNEAQEKGDLLEPDEIYRKHWYEFILTILCCDEIGALARTAIRNRKSIAIFFVQMTIFLGALLGAFFLIRQLLVVNILLCISPGPIVDHNLCNPSNPNNDLFITTMLWLGICIVAMGICLLILTVCFSCLRCKINKKKAELRHRYDNVLDPI